MTGIVIQTIVMGVLAFVGLMGAFELVVAICDREKTAASSRPR